MRAAGHPNPNVKGLDRPSAGFDSGFGRSKFDPHPTRRLRRRPLRQGEVKKTLDRSLIERSASAATRLCACRRALRPGSTRFPGTQNPGVNRLELARMGLVPGRRRLFLPPSTRVEESARRLTNWASRLHHSKARRARAARFFLSGLASARRRSTAVRRCRSAA